jgi:hypothetical protein
LSSSEGEFIWRIDPDPTGAFFVELAERYQAPFGTKAPADAADRVILVLRPTAVSEHWSLTPP